MSDPIVPIILAGGIGTRLWPLSRTDRPKQFLPLMGESTPYQNTLLRVGEPRYSEPIVVTNTAYRFLAAEQAQEAGITPGAILLEPQARNTAPAIAAAVAYAAARYGGDAILLILPSDHAIDKGEEYDACVELARSVASLGHHVTFGLAPDFPETAFGYVQAGEPLLRSACHVKSFIEKPDVALAEELIASDAFFWNSGMFMLQADAFLQDCALHAPAVHDAARAAVDGAGTDPDFIRLDAASFSASPRISVDHAIFEHTSRAAVVPASFSWSDLGTWNAVWDTIGKDDAGNAGCGSATFNNARDCLVVSERAHVVVDGMEDLAVIASDDAVFVGRLSDTQKIGSVVTMLGDNPVTAGLTRTHSRTHCPWGDHTSLFQGDGVKVKRLFVKPGRQLSLQVHRHRSEHWIVVRGTAHVTIDGQVSTVCENSAVHVPKGSSHRLSNRGTTMLEIIEVQTGHHLGEDDIVRIEDDFGRA